MILSDQTIKKLLKTQKIKITPKPTETQIQPSSVDLRLGNEYYKPITTEEALDIKNTEPKYQTLKPVSAIILPPNEFLLGTTQETITLPNNIAARVEGRSSIGRLGITIHVTAGFIDAGFNGQITLEIKNLSPQPIILYEGMRICQLVFEPLTTPADKPYGSAGNKYQNQKGVVGSLIYFDDDINPVR